MKKSMSVKNNKIKLFLLVLFFLFNIINGYCYDQEVNASNDIDCPGTLSTTNEGDNIGCNAGEFTTNVIISKDNNTQDTCIEGEYININVTLYFEKGTGNIRYDIGFYVGQEGNDPSYHLSSKKCSGTMFNDNPDPWGNKDSDSCGDFIGSGSSEVFIKNLKIKCVGNSEGNLIIPYIITWHQNSKTVCNDIVQLGSNITPPKCQNGTAVVNGITVLPKPVADYHFDECSWDGTPGEVKDSSLSNYHGTAHDSTTSDEAKIGRSGDFTADEVNDYVSIPTSAMDGLDDFSVSVWVKTDKNLPQQEILQGLEKGSTDNEFELYIETKNNNDDIIHVNVKGNTGSGVKFNAGKNKITDGKWHQIFVTRNENTVCVYVDGGKIKCTTSNKFKTGSLSIEDNSLIIGQEQDIAGGGFSSSQDFEGYIDELKIFNKTLTESQIKQIYNNELAGKNWDGTEREPINCTCTPEYDGILTPIEFEGGRFKTTNTYVNKTWDHITFQKPFREPPAVFVVIDKTGGHAASARIKNITKTGFDITIVEPPGYDGPHISQSLSYLAINKGVHKLGNQYIEVGEIKTKKVQGKYTPNGSIIGWEKVTTKVNFCDPAVVANIQTLNNLNSSDPQKQPPYKALIPWSTAVIDNITSNSFNLALDMSETNDGLINKDETVAYMISEGNIQDFFVDDDNNTILYETIKTQPYFEGWSNNCNTVNFKNNYSKTPLIAGWKNSRKEDDGGWFRICSLDKYKVGFVVDEDKDHDSERSHTKESGSIFVFTDNFVKREIILDHYLIEHDGVGLTCQPEKVTIKACTDNATPCTEYTSTTDITLNYNSTSQNYSFTGSTEADVIHHDAGTITLSLTNMNPTATNGYKCYNTAIGSDSCDITFYDSGFIFDIKDTYSYKPQDVIIKAVRKDDQTQACIPAFQNTSLDINFTFDNLSANPTNTAPEINNFTLPNNITLNFDNNGEATFNVVYKEAGKLSFTATYDNGTVFAVGSDTAVFKPFGFYVYTTDNNWQADNGANSTVFKKAGENFNLTVKAVGWQSDTDTDLSDNPVTVNYNEKNISVTHTLVEPFGGDNGSISVKYLDFTNGVASIDNQTFSEVGIIKFTTTDDDYLGAGSITGTSANIGRFIPDHFIIKSKTNGVLNDNGNFIYTGQTVTYLTKPEFIIEAQNKDNQTTKNYSGDFFKLDIGGISIIDPKTDDKTTGTDGNLLSVEINRANATFTINNDGSATYTFGDDNITYIRDNNSKIAPFIPQLTFKINSIIDNDSVSGIKLPDNISVTGSEMRYGRLKIYDNYGPETEDLEIDIETQYWDGKYWVLNTDDSHYSLSINDFKLDNYTEELNNGDTNIDNLTGINGGKGSLHLTAPGENNYGDVDICIDISSIIYNYLNDNESCGTATFGIYRGRDIIIDWQEIPPQ